MDFSEAKLLPTFKDLSLSRARVIHIRSKIVICLPIKNDLRALAHMQDIKDSLESLRDVVTELSTTSISIAKTEVIDNIEWSLIAKEIENHLITIPICVTICKMLIKLPDVASRPNIIQEAHNSLVGGHKGVTKTLKRVQERYAWKGMKTDIQEFIQRCRGCQLKKLVRIKTKQPMVLTDTPGSAFDKIAMDVVGPLTPTKAGNTHILTIQDLLTKYCVGVPLERITSIDIANALCKGFISRFGAPRAILTDQGTNFCSSLMKGIAKKFGIKLYHTTAFHPQSNGSIERSHHVLTEYLKQYVDQNQEWDELLDMAMYSYNTSEHEGTKYTPHELVFGKLARQPSSDPPLEEYNEPTYTEYLRELFYRINGLQELAAENLNAAKRNYKRLETERSYYIRN